MLKISYAGCYGLSPVISTQFTLEMCVAGWNCEKFTENPYVRSYQGVGRVLLELNKSNSWHGGRRVDITIIVTESMIAVLTDTCADTILTDDILTSNGQPVRCQQHALQHTVSKVSKVKRGFIERITLNITSNALLETLAISLCAISNRRSGVALAMRHRLSGPSSYGLNGLEREMSTPPTLRRGTADFTFFISNTTTSFLQVQFQFQTLTVKRLTWQLKTTSETFFSNINFKKYYKYGAEPNVRPRGIVSQTGDRICVKGGLKFRS